MNNCEVFFGVCNRDTMLNFFYVLLTGILIDCFISLGDGTVGLTEFRVDCVNRMAYKTIGELDAAYEKLLNVSNIG